MRIETYLNCSQELIETKNYNIFIWISLGNKYFSKENIEKYIKWALDNTKTDVVIILADLVHAINYEVFNKYNKDRAIRIAMKKSWELQQIIQDIINNIPLEQRNLVNIATWDNYRSTKNYINSLPLIINEFDKNKDFHDYIINIIKINLWERIARLSEERIGKLAYYIIDELPILINWFEFNWTLYNLHPYPWFSLLDELWMWIRSSSLFPELASKLEYKENIAQVEWYVD